MAVVNLSGRAVCFTGVMQNKSMKDDACKLLPSIGCKIIPSNMWDPQTDLVVKGSHAFSDGILQNADACGVEIIDEQTFLESFKQIQANADFLLMPDIETAIIKGSLEMVRYYIENGADVNQTTYDKEQNEITMVNLAFANSHRKTEIIKLLIASGADINARFTDDKGYPEDYMRTAIEYRMADVIKALFEAGFDITVISYRGEDVYNASSYMARMFDLRYDPDVLDEILPLFLAPEYEMDYASIKEMTRAELGSAEKQRAFYDAVLAKCLDINDENDSGALF